jgi:hypothetical protein
MTLIRKQGVTTAKVSNAQYDHVKAYSEATHVANARLHAAAA